MERNHAVNETHLKTKKKLFYVKPRANRAAGSRTCSSQVCLRNRELSVQEILLRLQADGRAVYDVIAPRIKPKVHTRKFGLIC